MLGTLAKWLRIMGYDTLYVKNISDDRICAIAKIEQRIILTRDRKLADDAPGAHYIQSKQLDDQVCNVINAFSLLIDENSFFSRCTLCNILVEPAKKETVKDRAPPAVYQNYDTFWICSRCGRVYWKGSHWTDVVVRIETFLRCTHGAHNKPEK